MALHRFEDLVAWQRARVLAREVNRCTGSEPFRRDFGLSAQVQRAAVSVMANIAEGFEKRRATEFGRYLDIAKGSLAEVRSHLYIAHDIGYVQDEDFELLMQLVDDSGKVIAGLRAAQIRLANVPDTGHRAPGTPS